MSLRVSQPPIDLVRRTQERPAFWPGLLATMAGLILGLFGFGRITGVETVQGNLALESQVNLAFAHGGVQYIQPKLPAPFRPGFGPPSELPGSLPSSGVGPLVLSGQSKIRIDLGAKAACPT